jgi:hypothetical protein
MVPTFFLSDGYLANGSEPWLVPSASDLPKVEARFTTEVEGFHPFRRDPDTLARNWAVPGTPGLEHRIGGIEKSYDSGNISYDPDNHEKMIHVRQEKVDRIARDLAPTEIFGSQSGGDLLILGWARGALVPRLRRLRHPGHDAEDHARAGRPAREHRVHLRHRLLQPLPVLHEHLRHPQHPRPRADAGHRAEAITNPELSSGSSPATATACPSAATTCSTPCGATST